MTMDAMRGAAGLRCFVTTVTLLGAAVGSAAEGNALLREGRALYEGFDYDGCVAKLQLAAQAESTPPERAEIELYAGLCEFHRDRIAAAQDRFLTALRLHPDLNPPPFTSPRIVALLEQLRSQVLRERALASPSPLAEPSRAARGPSWRTWTLAGAGVAAGGVAALTWVRAASLAGSANDAYFESDAYALGGRARTASYWAYGLTVVSSSLLFGAVLSHVLGPR